MSSRTSVSIPSTPESTRSIRRIVAGALLTAATATGVALTDATPAYATPPPMNCVDEPNQDGCPHNPKDGGGEPSSELRGFRFDGTDVWGNFYFSRSDGAGVTPYDAATVQGDLSFRTCVLVWPLQKRIKCQE